MKVKVVRRRGVVEESIESRTEAAIVIMIS